MRENKLLNLLKSVIGETSELRGHSWSSNYLKYFGGDHVSFVVCFLLGWVMLSIFMLYVVHRLQGRRPKVHLETQPKVNSEQEAEPQEVAESNARDTKTMVYKRVVENLCSINSNVEEFFVLSAREERNRVATAREAEEVATLLYDRWTPSVPRPRPKSKVSLGIAMEPILNQL